jgi:hypothetical protein
MAQKNNTEKKDYTPWVHLEREKRFLRRLHKIDATDEDGKVNYLRGDKMPRGIVTVSGPIFVDAPPSAIWVRPETHAKPRATPPGSAAWPRPRDVVYVFVGFISISIVRVIIALFEVL